MAGLKPPLAEIRPEFPLLDRVIYLNACSLGPLPRSGAAALRRYAEAWDAKGTPVWFSDWLPTLDRLRSRVAELLGAAPGTVALAPSVSVALTTMASAVARRDSRRRKVLIGGLDFPTMGHQWLSRPDLEVEFIASADGVSVSPGAFIERIDAETALVATTHLHFTTGYLQDVRPIAEAAHTAGALCLVDGYQSVGCVPIKVEELGCDVFIGGCLKWLSGGPGTAFIWCRPELIPQLEPVGTGWFATADPFSFTLDRLDWAPDARRFETGTWAVPSHYAALAALELILDQAGVDRICERLRDMTGRILERCDKAGFRVFTPRERERRCGVVTIEAERPEEVESRLHALGVIVDSRPGRVRLSPHWALTDDELERGMDAVEAELTRETAQSTL